MNKKILVILLAVFASFAQAKNVEFANMYYNQASPELVMLVDEVVQEIGYEGNYELVEPNKVGLQFNPWNGMIISYLNPQTQNNLISINPVWFNCLSKDEQKFLVARYITKLQNPGGLLTVITLIPLFFMLMLYLLAFGLFKLINRTRFKSQKLWKKILALWILLVAMNLFVSPKLQTATINYLAFKYEANIDQQVLAKLPNKQVAISALQAIDVAIKAGIADGHNAFKQHEHTFADLAKVLEK